MRNNQKITTSERERLLDLHLAGDRQATEAACVAAGVGKHYAAKLASERGYRPLCHAFASNRPRIAAIQREVLR